MKTSAIATLPNRWRRRVAAGSFLPKLGFLILAAMVLMAVFAPQLAPHDPERQVLRDRLLPPAWSEGGRAEYLLGTDSLGRDILSRGIYGTRSSLVIGLFGSLIATVIGTVLGVVAGYYGGWVDELLMRLLEVVLAIPRILFAILMVVLFGGGIGQLIVLSGLASWTWLARTVRSRVLTIRHEAYVQSAQVVGAGDGRILLTHVIPNAVNVIVVIAVMQFGSIIVLETTLSFLGLSGVALSWGADTALGREYLLRAWWPATIPGLFIFLTVSSVMMIGYWLRDRFDPHMKT